MERPQQVPRLVQLDDGTVVIKANKAIEVDTSPIKQEDDQEEKKTLPKLTSITEHQIVSYNTEEDVKSRRRIVNLSNYIEGMSSQRDKDDARSIAQNIISQQNSQPSEDNNEVRKTFDSKQSLDQRQPTDEDEVLNIESNSDQSSRGREFSPHRM